MKPKPLRVTRSTLDQVRDPVDRDLLHALAGSTAATNYSAPLADYHRSDDLEFHLLPNTALDLVPRMCNAGRAYVYLGPKEPLIPLRWDEGPPWELALELVKEKRRWLVRGSFRRGGEQMKITEAAIVAEGLLLTRGVAARFKGNRWDRWVEFLRRGSIIEAFPGQEEDLLAEMLADPNLPPLEVPEELKYQRATVEPRPIFRLHRSHPADGASALQGEVLFDYQGQIVPAGDTSQGTFDKETRTLVVRDLSRETQIEETLAGLTLKRGVSYRSDRTHWVVPPSRLPKVVRALLPQGWSVEAEGKLIRRPGATRVEVTSNIDWFELHATVDFDGVSAKLPDLLRALRRGETLVQLGDGSYGMLPEDWLKRLGAIPAYGEEGEESIKFRRSQVGLLDALLAEQPEIGFDEAFAKAREQVARFEAVRRAEQPAGFQGQLRGYQMDGLGWMHFLRQFGFGGCLADDMGVGKTPQVLALLEERRAEREAGATIPPSLVVVPKSLVFNWIQEAARFTPRLRVVDHTGTGRTTDLFQDADVILTTYGTLRRDAAEFRDHRFDYVVLDEAQAIKNASTESAKAARLLQADHRLALSGTPVENHLGELWSLFEFLNPGLLGGASALASAGAGTRTLDEDSRRLLARALRPFILRRTKEQVASELPPKVEQTLVCELEPDQRRLYNELREHYRSSLLNRLTDAGLKRSKIQVLEALLRLRQAACHPGLIDKRRSEEPSAKLDLLRLQLDDVLEEGRKAIIFSQFTSFLALLRSRLDEEKIAYEYLDGATRDRETPVQRFQTDPGRRLFLISLKAGGLGLNLTAAEYVFLLDPWWNPAVEAQAIDRAHRIGQDKQVFAYRLIAKDTVEEKILDLQRTKRDLADAILNADNSVIGNLTRDDFDMLLS
jgi:superfamily II DNA or RNA helicase